MLTFCSNVPQFQEVMIVLVTLATLSYLLFSLSSILSFLPSPSEPQARGEELMASLEREQ